MVSPAGLGETRALILERLLGDTGEPDKVKAAARSLAERSLPAIMQGLEEGLGISATLEVAEVELIRFAQARPTDSNHAMTIAASASSPDALVLSIDADEVVSPELARSIQEAIARPRAYVYAVDRLSSFCGTWVRHSGWYPDWLPRLFRRGSARFSDDLVHERLVFETPVHRLSGKLLHYSYEDFDTVLRKLDAYSSAGARQRAAAGKRGGFGMALVRGAWAFVRTWVLRAGFLDGRAGFMIAVFNAETVYYRFLKLARHARQDERRGR